MAINITDAAKERAIAPPWRMPFRPFFLCAATFSILALIAWLVNFLHGVSLGGIGPLWHMHEMIVGFAATTVVGFVLTAGQTWTGVPTVRGRGLQALVALWLIARLAWLMPPPNQWLAAWADLLFFLFAAAVIGRMVVLSRNWRNAFFSPVFVALGLVSVAYGLSLKEQNTALASQLLLVVFFLVVHVVLVVGGRVIPFFSDRGLQRENTPIPRWLELGALGASLLFLASFILDRNSGLTVASAAGVAALNLLRWLNWKPWQAWRTPLLWSLHTAYLFVISGFVLFALRMPFSAGIHLLAVGGVGLMILAMASRVSLGHSGRPLELPRGFPVAYLAMIVATLSRTAASFVPEYYALLLCLAGLGWTVGFGLFLYHYAPILLAPRIDGRPG
jgi:uncharacterized protein involved in response to NO